MAKSHTQKKYAKPAKHELRAVSNAATDYIKQWTERELGKIQQEQISPVCIPVKNGYKIGLYTLTVHPNKTCDVYNHCNEFIHRFENKVSAILYTIYTIKHKYYNADDLLLWDKEINKNYIDMLNLRRIIETANKNKDYATVDIRTARLEIAETKLTLAREKISNLHKTAKYYKIWE
jgi:hypothetical protein